MKELTFKSYLKTYLKEQSASNTLDITKLVEEIDAGNKELETSLVLYCVICDKMVTLRNVLRRTGVSISPDTVSFTEKELKSKTSSVPEKYKTIYTNYLNQIRECKISHEKKEELRKQILRLNKKRNISMRKLSIVAGVDSSNFNTFMKNKEYPKVSTDKLEKVVAFLSEE